MKTFHNDIKIKEKYVKRLKEHSKADEIIQGTGWENGKGCAVGCTLENYEHSQYPIELGIPEWLAYLEDSIFEGLENKEAVLFPVEFLEAIPVGVDENDLYKLRCDLDYKRLKNLLDNLEEKDNEWGVRSAIEECMRLNQEYLEPEDDKWSAAWSAARSAQSAARSAELAAELAAQSAAESATQSAARSAAWSAAWSAARSAARSAAESAAWSAVWSAAYYEISKELIRLLESEK